MGTAAGPGPPGDGAFTPWVGRIGSLVHRLHSIGWSKAIITRVVWPIGGPDPVPDGGRPGFGTRGRVKRSSVGKIPAKENELDLFPGVRKSGLSPGFSVVMEHSFLPAGDSGGL